MRDFVVMRARHTENIIKKLDPSKATGHDGIGALILRNIAKEVSLPLTLLLRRMISESTWPTVWKTHLLIPLYKKGSAFDAKNYRGIHLTTMLSKVSERMLGHHLVQHLQQYGFGSSQWAFRKHSSSRDLVLVRVSSWVLQICSGKESWHFHERHFRCFR